MQPSIAGSSASVYVTERMAVTHSWKCTVSFSFVVPLSFAATHCHLLSLVVTRCTTRLPFYKRSQCLVKTYYYLIQELFSSVRYTCSYNLLVKIYHKNALLFTYFIVSH